MSTNVVTKSIFGMQFGMGGPYKLVTAPGPAVFGPAVRYMRLKARQRRLRDAIQYKAHEGLPHEDEDRALDGLADEVMLAGAAAATAMYKGGCRWSVLAVEGRYLYLCRGIDDEGRKYDPQLKTGELSEHVRCNGCDGTGKRTYRRDLGPQTCFTCQGRGLYRLPLPETVRRAIDAEACERRRAADADMRAAAEAFDSEGATAEMEVAS